MTFLPARDEPLDLLAETFEGGLELFVRLDAPGEVARDGDRARFGLLRSS